MDDGRMRITGWQFIFQSVTELGPCIDWGTDAGEASPVTRAKRPCPVSERHRAGQCDEP